MKESTKKELFNIEVLALIFVAFVSITIGIVDCRDQQRAKKENIQENMVQKYHSNLAASLIWKDAILDSIYNDKIKNDTSFVEQYERITNEVLENPNNFKAPQIMYIAWCEYVRNWDMLDIDYDLDSYLEDPDFLKEKFYTFTEYYASDILVDNLQYWYMEGDSISNNY